MKKSLIYVLAPLIGLIIFGAIYWNFSAGYEAKEAAKAAVIRQARDAKVLEQARANEAAIKAANEGVAKRRAEREAKEAKDKRDHEARQAAVDARDKANTDRIKFNSQVTRLENDIKTEKDAITKLEDEKKKLTDELAFLRVYVKQADDNVKTLKTVLDKIAAADAARAAADAAAAAAEKAKKNS
jgi:hypothetical protein